MIQTCYECGVIYEDIFRHTFCPHEAFLANDGENNFEVHTEAYISRPYITVRLTPEEVARLAVDMTCAEDVDNIVLEDDSQIKSIRHQIREDIKGKLK